MQPGPQPRVAAIVPMRHFSRRVSGKNYRLLGGRPLFRYIVETLLAVPEIDEVVIDTDSELIASDVQRHLPSVTIVARPAHLRSEMLTMNEILLHTVTQVDADVYLQTHSTNPMLRAETISAALNAFRSAGDEHDSLFSVTPLYTRLWTADGKAVNHDPDHLIRTQDLEPVMEENSCMYVFTRDVLEARRNRIGERPLVWVMDSGEASDIDTELDWAVVRSMLESSTT